MRRVRRSLRILRLCLRLTSRLPDEWLVRWSAPFRMSSLLPHIARDEGRRAQMRLLVVEDDGRLVRVLRRGLQSEGYDVDVARTGPEALSQADAHEYDAVLLD